MPIKSAELLSHNGEQKITINAGNVSHIYPNDDMSCVVSFVGNDEIVVRMPYDTVRELIFG